MRPLHRSCQTSRDFVPWRFRSPVASPVDSFVIPATENLHISGHSAGGQTAAALHKALSSAGKPARDPLMLQSAAHWFYFLRVATAATAALQSSLKLERAFLMQATFWMRRRSVPHCFSTSARHVFPAAATSANLALHTSESSVPCTLSSHAEVTRFDVGAGFFISSAQAPNCAIALDTSRNDILRLIEVSVENP